MSGRLRFVYLIPEVEVSPAGKAVLRWPQGREPFGAELEHEDNAALASVQVTPGAFSAEECDRIVALGEASPPVRGAVEYGAAAMRESTLAWVEPAEQAKWLYHRVGVLIANANRAYRFALTGFAEPLQYARYGANGHFDWHTDLGAAGTGGRKLSLTLQLSDPADYEGGALEFISMRDTGAARARGTAIVFPSYLAHRVAPVTRGERRSIVAWAYGPSLR